LSNNDVAAKCLLSSPLSLAGVGLLTKMNLSLSFL
jgi:hypothetical protein